MYLQGLPPQNELEILGNEMRDYARSHPCMVAEDGLDRDFHRLLGEKYQVCLTLETWKNPYEWHASICILHEIGSGTNKTFGMPEQAILNVVRWPEEEKKNAREILGYVIGPVIIGGKDHPIVEVAGLFSLHWCTPAYKLFPVASLEEH